VVWSAVITEVLQASGVDGAPAPVGKFLGANADRPAMSHHRARPCPLCLLRHFGYMHNETGFWQQGGELKRFEFVSSDLGMAI
jgi:hypothetical protein